jgi:hypothetical protein
VLHDGVVEHLAIVEHVCEPGAPPLDTELVEQRATTVPRVCMTSWPSTRSTSNATNVTTIDV